MSLKTDYNLFLDDNRIPTDVTWVNLPKCSWVVVKNYKSFRETIWNMGIPKFITYDHDLADCHYGHGLKGDEILYDSYDEKTGYECAKFLVNECNKLGEELNKTFFIFDKKVKSIVNRENKSIELGHS